MSRLLENTSLKPYNSFDIEVNAKYLFEFTKPEQALSFLKDFDTYKTKILILGGGSNILFTQDYTGLIIHPQIKGIEIIEENNETVLVKVGAGEVWDEFVEWAVRHKFYGIENLSLIPGSATKV